MTEVRVSPLGEVCNSFSVDEAPSFSRQESHWLMCFSDW